MAHPPRTPAPADGERFMCLLPDRVLYAGLLGRPAQRTMGAHCVYVATRGRLRLRLAGGEWQEGELAVVPPYLPHEVQSEARQVLVLQAEAETVAPGALPAPLDRQGVVDDTGFVARLRAAADELRARAPARALGGAELDRLCFGAPLPARRLDARIGRVVEAIRRDPSAAMAAEDCARSVHLSFSRFLHLFRAEVGVPFRSFRTWKRARSLLHHVKSGASLVHVALDTGYPDSTHFSHSIRAAYGLKPSDIVAGSRRLAVYTLVG